MPPIKAGALCLTREMTALSIVLYCHKHSRGLLFQTPEMHMISVVERTEAGDIRRKLCQDTLRASIT